MTVRRIDKGWSQEADSTSPLFLKRTGFKPASSVWRQLARSIRKREMPHSEAFHVHLAATALSKAGIKVMPILAVGERRFFGFWPLDAFVLVGSAIGTDALLIYRSGSPSERTALMAALGKLLANVHSAGYFYIIRLSDIFCDFTIIS